jgi:sugar phosphate isomerase/epimerase
MNQIALFMKPWKSLSLDQAASKAEAFAVDAVELPARPGFWLDPASSAEQARNVAAAFSAQQLAVASLGSVPTEATIRLAAAINPHPLLRFMISVPEGDSYRAIERAWIKRLAALLPLAEELGVTLALQNHDQRFVANAAGVLRILEPLRSTRIGTVWDPAHCAFAGEIPEHALDLLEPHLCMVNVKNGCYLLDSGPEAPRAHWRRYWTTMQHGLVDWERVIDLLREREYPGPYCIFAEFCEEEHLDQYTRNDIDRLRNLLKEGVP